jgi:Protein of unknown function (DUF3140)
VAKPRHHRDRWKEFRDSVNMTAGQLEKWLRTDESKADGQKSGGESTGHASGGRIVSLLRSTMSDLTDDDGHMRKVVRESAWRYSLMNGGHDPCK